jgi:hypothetical protein
VGRLRWLVFCYQSGVLDSLWLELWTGRLNFF